MANRVHRWTLDLYLRAIDDGYFPPDLRAELIDGFIIELMPIGTPHAYATRTLRNYFSSRLGERFVVGSQEPIALNDRSRPEPDLWLATPPPEQYGHRDPGPSDLLLLCEVADSSFDYDYGTKRSLYASERVPEYWIVDVKRRRVLTFADPDGEGAYAETKIYVQTELIQHAEFGTISIGSLFVD